MDEHHGDSSSFEGPPPRIPSFGTILTGGIRTGSIRERSLKGATMVYRRALSLSGVFLLALLVGVVIRIGVVTGWNRNHDRREARVAVPVPRAETDDTDSASPSTTRTDHPAVAPPAHRVGTDAPSLESVAALAAPEPFDAVAYAADPAEYCAKTVPGRAFQTAQPGPGVPQIRVVGAAMHELPHLGRTRLTVAVPPGAPVTFLATDLGAFENGKSSITVPANRAGRAAVTYEALAGTVGDAHVTAGCPLAGGRANFLLVVAAADPPEKTGEVAAIVDETH